MLGPTTMKPGILLHNSKSSRKQKLQVCKQQQTASGNVNLYHLYWPTVVYHMMSLLHHLWMNDVIDLKSAMKDAAVWLLPEAVLHALMCI